MLGAEASACRCRTIGRRRRRRLKSCGYPVEHCPEKATERLQGSLPKGALRMDERTLAGHSGDK